ncbi:unnamed protein product, partial [Polarella glacialis]
MPPLLRRKKAADDATRRGDYAEALEIYEELLRDFESVSESSAAEGDPASLSRATLLSNAALCTLKLSPLQPNWAHVRRMLLRTLALSNEALSLEPENAKAHFRRACALESLERFSEAYLAYQTAALLAPMDARVRESLERASRYDASELGPEISAEVAARKTAEHAAQVRKRQLQKQKMMRAIAKEEVNETAVPKAGFNLDGSPLATCCWCTRGCRGGDFYAAPCGHGPFCGACRGRIS